MSVTYEQAMQTLTAMFGDIDKEVIGMILQANGGHMEKTVENLLAMSAQSEPSRPAPPRAQPQPVQQPRSSQPHQQQQQPQQQQPHYHQQPPMQQYQQHPPQPYQPMPYPYQQPIQQQFPQQPMHQQPYPIYNPAYPGQPPLQQQPLYQQPYHQMPPPQQQQQQPQSPPRQDFHEQKSGPQPAPQVRQPAPPAPVDPIYQLPDDFMRAPSFFQSICGPPPAMMLQPPMAVASSRESQIEQDHLLAQMLNDQQFMQDLANNPERYRNAQQAPPSPALRPEPQQQQQQQSARSSAPPAVQPQPNYFLEPAHAGGAAAVAAGSVAAASPIWTPPPRAGASAVGIGSEPLHPRLESLHHGGAPSGNGPSKEQQSSFAKKWGSLTAGAREKLARLSERFKKDPAHDSDMDGGGAYNQMHQLNDVDDGPEIDRRQQRNNDRFAHEDEVAPGSHASFISAEEAADLQAGYAFGSHKGKKKNAFIDDGTMRAYSQAAQSDVDPFGNGANGSDMDEDSVSVGGPSSNALPQRGTELFPQMSRTISGVQANENGEDEDGYRPPRLSSGSPEEAAAAAAASRSSGMHHLSAASLVDPPSDDDTPSVPAARKKSAAGGVAPGAKQKKQAMPLLQDM